MPAQQGAGAGRPPIAAAPDAASSARGGAGLRGASSGRLQAEQVRAMFDRIAGVYDGMNTAMTAGLHHRWRARAAERARVGPGARVLDVATGTGDLAVELAHRVWPGGEVVGCDFSEAMLARARAKAHTGEGRHVRPTFEWADALSLPYGGDVFDAATVGFGARNFEDLQRGLQEMVRVVRPGGRVVVLELTTPTRAPLSAFYRLWFERAVPLLGRLAGAVATALSVLREPGSQGTIAGAYAYLPNSVKRFPPPRELAAEMQRAGLGEIEWLLLAGGIVAVHAGTVLRETA